MKNILVEFLGKNGAGVSFTYEISKAFAKEGYRVYVLLSDKVLNREQWELVDKTSILTYFIDTGNKKNICLKSIKFLLSKNSLLQELKSIDFLFAFRAFPHPWMEIIEKRINIHKVFFVLHDPDPHTGTEWYRKVIARRSIKTASDIVVLSKKFVPLVINKYKIEAKHVHYMKLGLLPAWDRGYEKTDIDLGNLDGNCVNYLFFGRIDKYKGLHILAKAYESIEMKSMVNLIIAGSGDFSEYKEEYSRLDRCHVINRYLKDSEMAALFSLENTVVVLPYIDASQSGVIPLAVEYSCPVIASDTGALKEQLDNGQVGIFVKPNDPMELSNAMKRFLVDENLFLNEKNKMIKLKESLEWTNIIEEFLEGIGIDD